MTAPSSLRTTLAAIAASVLAACSSADPDAGPGATAAADAGPKSWDDPAVGFDEAAITELRALGYDKYVGKFQPSTTEPTDTTTYYTFAADESGPICMRGDAFNASIRPGTSEDLLIFLQGGGACWTGKCIVTEGNSGGPWPVGWTDGDAAQNPLGPMPLLTIEYCDGSVFAGDGEVPDADHGAPDGIRYHHGLANLTAALDLGKREFPSPRRIVVVGTSAGGYGTILSSALVRLIWPHTHLYVIDDAGPGLTNPKLPEMYTTILKEWKLEGRIPKGCTGCADKQFLPLVGWVIEHDPSVRFGLFSAYGDEVISHDFLSMTGGAFRTLLVGESGKVHDAHPESFERYFVDGVKHTALLAGYYDVRVGGVSLPEWTRRMIDDDPAWADAMAPIK